MEKLEKSIFFMEPDAFGALIQQENRLVKAREIKGVTYIPLKSRGSFSKLAQIRVVFWVAKCYQGCTDNSWGLRVGFVFESCEGCAGSSLRQCCWM